MSLSIVTLKAALNVLFLPMLRSYTESLIDQIIPYRPVNSFLECMLFFDFPRNFEQEALWIFPLIFYFRVDHHQIFYFWMN